MFNFFKTLWLSNWKNKAMLVFAALVLVSATVSIIYGISSGQ